MLGAKALNRAPKLVFCVEKCTCKIATAMLEASRRAGHTGSEAHDTNDDPRDILSKFPSVPSLTIRVLRITFTPNGRMEEWFRVSGDNRVLKEFISRLKKFRSSEARFTLVYKNKFGAIILVNHEPWSECRECPMIKVPEGVMPKSVLLLPGLRVLELIVMEKSLVDKILCERGCKAIRIGDIDEMDYMLTPKQEQALMLAFALGYYDTPKGARLEDIAREMGLSVSTIAELISKAEAKVVEAFVRHEMPHYMAFKIMLGRRRRRIKAMRARRTRAPSVTSVSLVPA